MPDDTLSPLEMRVGALERDAKELERRLIELENVTALNILHKQDEARAKRDAGADLALMLCGMALGMWAGRELALRLG